MTAKDLKARTFSSPQILSAIAVLAVLLFYVMSVAGGESLRAVSIPVVLGMLLNGAISIAFIATDDRGVSLAKAHWYFVLIFLSVAPLAQYLTSYCPWGYAISEDLMVGANGVITLWCVFFGATYTLASRKWGGPSRCRMAEPRESVLLPSGLLSGTALVALCVAVFAYLAGRYGLAEMTSERVSYGLSATSWADWILSYALPAIPALGCCHCLLLSKARKAWLAPAALLFVLTLFCMNPVYGSRYSVAAAYLPILLALLPQGALRNRTFDVVILVAVIMVFPMMNAFKTMTLDQVTLGYLLENFAGSYRSIDFDAYSMVARTLQYVDGAGLCMGTQLVGSLLYGLPGMASKVSVATGELVSSAQGASYTNLSAPLQAEAYVDFGLAGVVAYAALIALVFEALDRSFWKQEGNDDSFLTIAFFVLVAFAMFLMRGALQPVAFRMWTFLLPLGALYLGCRLLSWALAERGRL